MKLQGITPGVREIDARGRLQGPGLRRADRRRKCRDNAGVIEKARTATDFQNLTLDKLWREDADIL